ncbi:phosphotransferase [Demequina iriomotensis]|uniref:phosphotransferase n=1 Tax=Demequina iriomotensis TaxID=1536641 RepID=UPI0007855663|nr:phosphotransferase [Demequina iriomotensis]
MAGLTAPHALGPLTRRLLALALVTPEDVHRHGLRARDLSRSHAVALVEAGDARRYVVKELQRADERSQGTPEQERALYGAVAAHPELRAWTAGVVHLGDVDDVLVLDYLAGAESVVARAARTGWSDGELATHLGAALGGWHAAARPRLGAFEAVEPPWVLRVLEPDRPGFVRTNDAVAEALATLDGGPLARWLRVLREGWRDDAVIHGDLQFDNCLVEPSGRITFVDWECAGRGDAAWDLAALAAELISRSPARDAASMTPVLSGAVRLLVAAYAEHDEAAGGASALAGRVVPYAGARLLLRALQIASREDGEPGAISPAVRWHLTLAEAVASAPDLAAAVSGGSR